MRRAWGWRTGARVICVNDGSVLLLADSDPGVPGSQWWVTPGGGIDAGETARAAAQRELREETGLVIEPDALVGPVAVRTVTHGYSDRVRVQREWFFRADVERFDVNSSGLTPAEKMRMKGHAWWPLDQLPSEVWPARLAEMAALTGHEILDLGEVDESTVPVVPRATD